MNVSLARAQACYLEKPEDRLIHLVEERNALYEKEWFSGLRFFKSRKPKDRLGSHKRSTGACKARLCHWAECSTEVRSPFLLDIFCGWCWLFYSIEQPSKYNVHNWNIYATIYLNIEGGCKDKMPVSSKNTRQKQFASKIWMRKESRARLLLRRRWGKQMREFG